DDHVLSAYFFFSSRRRHTRFSRDWSSDVCSSDLEAQAQAFWRMRTGLSEVQKHEGGSIKHDVSVPVSAVPEFIRRATDAAQEVRSEERRVGKECRSRGERRRLERRRSV